MQRCSFEYIWSVYEYEFPHVVGFRVAQGSTTRSPLNNSLNPIR